MKEKTPPKGIAHGVLKVGDRLGRRLNDLSIRAKLLAFAVTLIGLMLLLAVFAQVRIFEIMNRQIPARSAAREMQSALLSMRIYEQQFIDNVQSLDTEFYLKRESSALKLWRESYQEFESNHAKLSRLYSGTTLEMDHLKPILSNMQQYRDTFLALSSTYLERGFQSFGRVGVLQQRAQQLQEALEGRATVQNILLRMRQAQGDFLLHKDMTAANAFTSLGEQLQGQLASAPEQIALEEYMRIFQDVVQLDRKIGLTPNEGLIGTLDQYVNQATPHAQTAEADVLSSTDYNIQSISRSIAVATVLVTIAAIALAIIISRFIDKRLQLLLQASQRLSSGNLGHRVAVKGKDELGRLTESFNTMAEKLQHDRQVLRERAVELADSVKRFELVSRAVNEAIYEWNIERDVVDWGEGLATVFGYRSKDRSVTIDWWSERIHADDAQRVNNALSERFQRHSSTWKITYRFRRANGKYAYCQDRGFIEYKDGQPVRMVGSLIDVTRAMELERAKDEFISIASHQLRTPLGSIRWNLELLIEKLSTLPKDTQINIQEAYGSTQRMLGLVADLLSVARIEQGRVQDMPQRIDIVSVIEQAMNEMHPLAKQRKTHLDGSGLHGKSIEATIDPKRFREVIQNLLSNAVKYTPFGGDVKVSAALKKDPDSIVISIADNGIGIPSEEQANMFSKFFRAKNVLTTDTEGSGLGLFVVKSYVEGWGGRIWFTSQQGKGTTFYISIPRAPRLQKTTSER